MLTVTETTSATVDHCQGCDQDCTGVRDYDVTYNEHASQPGATERVRYCEDCAGLAGANWNGAIASIERRTPR